MSKIGKIIFKFLCIDSFISRGRQIIKHKCDLNSSKCGIKMIPMRWNTLYDIKTIILTKWICIFPHKNGIYRKNCHKHRSNPEMKIFFNHRNHTSLHHIKIQNDKRIFPLNLEYILIDHVSVILPWLMRPAENTNAHDNSANVYKMSLHHKNAPINLWESRRLFERCKQPFWQNATNRLNISKRLSFPGFGDFLFDDINVVCG